MMVHAIGSLMRSIVQLVLLEMGAAGRGTATQRSRACSRRDPNAIRVQYGHTHTLQLTLIGFSF